MVEKIHNIKNIKRNRKELTSSLTPAETNLWFENKNIFENRGVALEEIRRNFFIKQTTPNPSLTKEGSLMPQKCPSYFRTNSRRFKQGSYRGKISCVESTRLKEERTKN